MNRKGGIAVEEENRKMEGWRMPLAVIPCAFFAVELFAWAVLGTADNAWPLAFGLLWAGLLTGFVRALPALGGRIAFGILFFAFNLYTVVQTGYFILFNQMMWLTEFRYASEGSEFFSVLLQYPIWWWLYLAGSMALGVLILVKFPRREKQWLLR